MDDVTLEGRCLSCGKTFHFTGQVYASGWIEALLLFDCDCCKRHGSIVWASNRAVLNALDICPDIVWPDEALAHAQHG